MNNFNRFKEPATTYCFKTARGGLNTSKVSDSDSESSSGESSGADSDPQHKKCRRAYTNHVNTQRAMEKAKEHCKCYKDCKAKEIQMDRAKAMEMKTCNDNKNFGPGTCKKAK